MNSKLVFDEEEGIAERSPDGRYIMYDETLGCGSFKVVYKGFDEINCEIELCSGDDIARDQCIDTKRVIVNAPNSGDIIYGVGHQHIRGTGVALYGEDGRVLCSSVPIYGEGNEAGNEAGYVVGMSTCYPQPGSVKMSYGETIVLESNYSSSQKHSGVMGMIYIMVAEHTLELDSRSIASTQIDKKSKMPNYIWIRIIFGVVISTAIGAIVVFAYLRTNSKEDKYESLVNW